MFALQDCNTPNKKQFKDFIIKCLHYFTPTVDKSFIEYYASNKYSLLYMKHIDKTYLDFIHYMYPLYPDADEIVEWIR